MSALPDEIFVAIFLHLPPSVLASAAGVCCRWKAVAEWLLYTDISISETLPPPFLLPRVTTGCCRTINSQPHLASNLRKLHVRWTFDCADVYLAPFLGTALPDLSSAISRSTHLQSLHLDLDLPSYLSLPLAQSLRRDTIFPALQSLSLRAVGRLKHYDLHQLLRNTPSLQCLRLPDYHDHLSLDLDILPSLTSFCGSPAAAATILPGRPVQSLSLIGNFCSHDSDLSQMAKTSVPLRHLDLSAMLVDPILLLKVSKHFAMIESLKVLVEHLDTTHPMFQHVLGGFKCLSTLDLSLPLFGLPRPGGSAEAEQQLCHSWQNDCPTLRRIVFPLQTGWTYDQGRDQWLPVVVANDKRDFEDA